MPSSSESIEWRIACIIDNGVASCSSYHLLAYLATILADEFEQNRLISTSIIDGSGRGSVDYGPYTES